MYVTVTVTVTTCLGKPVTMTAEWSLMRSTENTRQSNLVNGINSIVLTKKSSNELLRVLQGTQNTFAVDNICPKFLKVSSTTTSYPVEALMISYEGWKNDFSNLCIR